MNTESDGEFFFSDASLAAAAWCRRVALALEFIHLMYGDGEADVHTKQNHFDQNSQALVTGQKQHDLQNMCVRMSFLFIRSLCSTAKQFRPSGPRAVSFTLPALPCHCAFAVRLTSLVFSIFAFHFVAALRFRHSPFHNCPFDATDSEMELHRSTLSGPASIARVVRITGEPETMKSDTCEIMNCAMFLFTFDICM